MSAPVSSRGSGFPQAVRQALAIGPASSAWERTVDITTVGARSGRPRRIEIWFHRVDGRWYLSSTPARRDWYANLLANPRFTFHLKHGVRADLAAEARPVPDPEERLRILQAVVDDLNQPHDPARLDQRQRVEDWMAGSPLLEIVFLPAADA
jgi:deazaflavin-dependent oxidoreductase (nitroreductase family)